MKKRSEQVEYDLPVESLEDYLELRRRLEQLGLTDAQVAARLDWIVVRQYAPERDRRTPPAKAEYRRDLRRVLGLPAKGAYLRIRRSRAAA